MNFISYVFKYIFREISNDKRFTILFLLNLSLGLTGFIALDGFKVSIDQTIKSRSKGILGADFGISSRRKVTEREISLIEKQFGKNIEKSQMVELFSMVSNTKGKSKLMQIKAIDSKFPFYGEIELDEPATSKDLKDVNQVWVYDDVLILLKTKKGEYLKIGDEKFLISRIVTRDSAAGISTNMAPRVYIHYSQIENTGLIRPGSVAWHSFVFKIPNITSNELEDKKDQIFKELDNPDIRVYTHENTSQQMARMLSRLNDFLGLTSLVALFLAALGTGFLFRSYFRSKTKQIAVLISLGMPSRSAFSIYLFQIVFLGLISSILAAIMALLIVPGLGYVTSGLLPFDIDFVIRPSTIILGMIVGTLGCLLICLPVLIGLKDLKPAILLIDKSPETKNGLTTILSSLPVLAFFWALAIWLSHSYQIGSLFMMAFIISGALLAGTSWFLFNKLNFFKFIKSTSLRWALRDLNRNRITTFACFISIGLGTLLLNLIPQIQVSLDEELKAPEKSKIPSLFIFDIQEEQVEQFRSTVEKENISISQLSPMVRARLKSVNGKEFDKGAGASSKNLSREEEREMRFRNRGFNLSYRSKLINSEKLYKGRHFSGNYDENSDKLPEISLEKRFASRLGIAIGDTLTFDIESIPIKGKVIGLREIKWTSFQPNFFIQFQPGVLEMAPKTFIATIPSMDKRTKEKLQDTLVEQLPNITMINVSSLVARIGQMMDQMAWALKFMSVLCLGAGLIVIYSIANHQSRNRKWDIGLLKSLGASFETIRAQFLWQFAIISLISTLLGAMISLLVSYVISAVLFDGVWVFNLLTPTLSIIVCVVLTVFITNLAISKSLKTRTRELFST
jgi:putative ABC transport system permease protein